MALAPSFALGRRPVEVDHHLVDVLLAGDIDPHQGGPDRVHDVSDSLGHPLARPSFAAITQLNRLERAGRGP